jgi:signal transduction histidine kinase
LKHGWQLIERGKHFSRRPGCVARPAVTGQEGAPLDFISYHARGHNEVAEGRVRMGLARHLRDVDKGLQPIKRLRCPVNSSERQSVSLQEALFNVRKHSAARQVLVRFLSEQGLSKLIIEDDGQGFPSGRHCHPHPGEAGRSCPRCLAG